MCKFTRAQIETGFDKYALRLVVSVHRISISPVIQKSSGKILVAWNTGWTLVVCISHRSGK